MNNNSKNNAFLLASVLVLVVLCFLSINAPVRFQREQAAREAAVKQRLAKIRVAEELYRRQTGAYTADLSKLVKAGLLSHAMTFIPYSDGKQFSLTATTILGKSGKQIPLMECGAGFADYLNGLDKNSIANLVDQANAAGRYAGLKIGDITQPNGNAGNWE